MDTNMENIATDQSGFEVDTNQLALFSDAPVDANQLELFNG